MESSPFVAYKQLGRRRCGRIGYAARGSGSPVCCGGWHQTRSEAGKYLHTMVRVSNLEESVDFYTKKLGLVEVSRHDVEPGRFTLVFLATHADSEAQVELTYNWDPEEYSGGRNFGHLAYGVDDIYETCARLQAGGVTINRPPRDGYMAFVRSPDGISIELLQKGEHKAPAEPWASMPNTGEW